MIAMVSASAAAGSWMFDAAVEGDQGGEHEKQQRVRCRVQCKIEEAVDQHRKAARERARRHSATTWIAASRAIGQVS